MFRPFCCLLFSAIAFGGSIAAQAPARPAMLVFLHVTVINPGSGFVAGTVSDNTSVMLLAKYTAGPVKRPAGASFAPTNPGWPPARRAVLL